MEVEISKAALANSMRYGVLPNAEHLYEILPHRIIYILPEFGIFSEMSTLIFCIMFRSGMHEGNRSLFWRRLVSCLSGASTRPILVEVVTLSVLAFVAWVDLGREDSCQTLCEAAGIKSELRTDNGGAKCAA